MARVGGRVLQDVKKVLRGHLGGAANHSSSLFCLSTNSIFGVEACFGCSNASFFSSLSSAPPAVGGGNKSEKRGGEALWREFISVRTKTNINSWSARGGLKQDLLLPLRAPTCLGGSERRWYSSASTTGSETGTDTGTEKKDGNKADQSEASAGGSKEEGNSESTVVEKQETQEEKPLAQGRSQEEKESITLTVPKDYEEAEDDIFQMSEDLLPNINKPLYNVWEHLPEDEQDALVWGDSNVEDGVGEEEIEETDHDQVEGEIGRLLAEAYENDQWDISEEEEEEGAEELANAGRELEQVEQTIGEAGSPKTLKAVRDFKDTIFQWEYFLVLHPQAIALPRHPLNDKVRLTVNLENLREYYGLSQAQKSHIALICGPRYKSKSDTILLTTQTHASRVDNQRTLMKIVTDLVEEAKSFIPA